MNVIEVDYRTLSDETVRELRDAARDHGEAVVLQSPVESEVDARYARERDRRPTPSLPDGVGVGRENFETLRRRLEAADLEVVVVESFSGRRETASESSEPDPLLTALSFVPLLLFAPVGYVLRRTGHERLRRRLLGVAMVGPAGRFYDAYANTLRERLERESQSLADRTGTDPLVVAEAGLR